MRLRYSFARTALAAALPTLLVLAGCGGEEYPEMARVTGTVTYKGKPVPNIMVNFMPAAGRPSWGKTDPAGKFELVYDENKKGAMMGHHKVYFTPGTQTIDGGTSAASKKAIAEGSGLTPEDMSAIRTKYGAEEVTKLEVDVKKDPEVLDLKLE
ncbi:MAG: hypothetical protein U0835_03550 [Isosphaeraceae bacterium]